MEPGEAMALPRGALQVFPASGGKIVICRAVRTFGFLQSSFEAELLALEWGLDVYMNLINNGIYPGEVVG